MSLNTTPRTWVSGAILTAAQLNTEVRDAFTGVQAAWTSFTPTLTGITLGNGTVTCVYLQVGKTIKVRCQFLSGTTTSYSAATLAMTLPVTPHTDYTSNGNYPVGIAHVQPNATATRRVASAFITSASVLSFLAADAANSTVTNLVPATWTAGTGTSQISFTIEYEAA